MGPLIRAAATKSSGKLKPGPPVGEGLAAVNYPSRTALDPLLKAVVDNASKWEKWVGESSRDWVSVIARPYVHPMSTSLSWHRDSYSATSGAFVFYAHLEWNMSWGGEL